jgi:CRP/FNR family transcriptional regulator, cyclic AMP receptor protein
MPLRSRDSKVELISKVPLFAGCSKKELRTVAMIADYIDFREGKELIREGAIGREFFVLVEGTAEVRRKGKRIDTLVAGDFFGEMALITRQPRNATVTTSSPVRALVVTETNFRRLLREQPQISLKVLEAVAARVPPATQ